MSVPADVAARFHSAFIPEPNSGCWLWEKATTPFGHGILRVARKNVIASRLSWMIHRGPIGEACVLHRCDVPQCVNPDHLFLGTKKDNSRDMVRKGRCPNPAGERAAKAKLTERDVRDIRSKRISRRAYQRLYGVSYSAVVAAERGFSWKQLED